MALPVSVDWNSGLRKLEPCIRSFLLGLKDDASRCAPADNVILRGLPWLRKGQGLPETETLQPCGDPVFKVNWNSPSHISAVVEYRLSLRRFSPIACTQDTGDLRKTRIAIADLELHPVPRSLQL
jgi:hypothetical protein